MNEDTLNQIQALRQKVYREAMGLEVDSTQGKDSGATQLSSLVTAYLKLEARENQISREAVSQEQRIPKVSAAYLPTFPRAQ